MDLFLKFPLILFHVLNCLIKVLVILDVSFIPCFFWLIAILFLNWFFKKKLIVTSIKTVLIIYFVSLLLSYFLLYQQQSYCEIKIFSLKCHKENAVDTLPSPIGDFEGSFSDSRSIPRVLMSNKHLIWKWRLPPPKDVYWLIVQKTSRTSAERPVYVQLCPA